MHCATKDNLFRPLRHFFHCTKILSSPYSGIMFVDNSIGVKKHSSEYTILFIYPAPFFTFITECRANSNLFRQSIGSRCGRKYILNKKFSLYREARVEWWIWKFEALFQKSLSIPFCYQETRILYCLYHWSS